MTNYSGSQIVIHYKHINADHSNALLACLSWSLARVQLGEGKSLAKLYILFLCRSENTNIYLYDIETIITCFPGQSARHNRRHSSYDLSIWNISF